MLPNFLIVGAQKAGTTSLHHYLRAHPDIYLPAQKETKFFVHEKYYKNGVGFYEDTFFSERTLESAVGEVDPDIMYYDQAPLRIARHLDLDTLRLVFILRNPVDRAFSHYLMSYRRGQEPLSFEAAIAAESSRIALGHMESLRYSYVTRGNYLRQIERFLGCVDRSRMLFLLTEDLETDALRCMREVYRFLGVAEDFVPPNVAERFHRATVPRSHSLLRRIKSKGLEKQLMQWLIPSAALRQSLRTMLLRMNQTSRSDIFLRLDTRLSLVDEFRDENEQLAAFLGRNLDHWNHAPGGTGAQS